MIVGIQTKMVGQVRAFFLIHYHLAFGTLFQRVEKGGCTSFASLSQMGGVWFF